MEISKELLSEVLGSPLSYLNISCDNKCEVRHSTMFENYQEGVAYTYLYGNQETRFMSKYELASKLKEWAFTRGYLLSSFKRFNELNYGCVIDTQHSPTCNECGESVGIHFVLGDSEPEAIIKACEWILNEKQS